MLLGEPEDVHALALAEVLCDGVPGQLRSVHEAARLVHGARFDEDGERVHEAGAAQALRRDVVAQNRQLQPIFAPAHMADGAGDGGHALGDFRAFKGGAGGGGAAVVASVCFEGDFAVGADVDVKAIALEVFKVRGEHAHGDVAADVRVDAGGVVDDGVVGRRVEAVVRDFVPEQAHGRKRRDAHPNGRHVRGKVLHDGVAGDGEAADVFRVGAGFAAGLQNELFKLVLNQLREHGMAVFGAVLDAADDVGAERALGVDAAGCGDFLAGCKVHEVADDRRRPDVDANAKLRRHWLGRGARVAGDFHRQRVRQVHFPVALDGRLAGLDPRAVGGEADEAFPALPAAAAGRFEGNARRANRVIQRCADGGAVRCQQLSGTVNLEFRQCFALLYLICLVLHHFAKQRPLVAVRHARENERPDGRLRARQADEPVAVRARREGIALVARLAVDEHLDRLADEGGVLFRADDILQLHEPLKPLVDDFARGVVLHPGRGRALALGVHEGKQRVEPDGAEQRHRLLKILLRLAGEADDDVAREDEVRHVMPRHFDELKVVRLRVVAVHRF